MAENQKLPGRFEVRRRPHNTKVIAPLFALQDVSDPAAKHPLARQEAAAVVGGSFLRARRLEQGKFAQKVHHLRQARPKRRDKLLRLKSWCHGSGMLTTAGNLSNDRRHKSKDGKALGEEDGCAARPDCL